MTSRARIRRALALAVALLLVPCAVALADRATFDRVSNVYANNGGRLEPCSFTQADLEAALAGIPPAFEDVVPDLRRAIEDGVAAHRRGDCRGVEPDGGASAPTTTPTTPPVDTTVTPPPADTTAVPPADAGAVPPAGTPPASTQPGTIVSPDGTVTTPSTQPPGVKRDTTPLVVGAAALGGLLLALLLLWGWARMRGWDPDWVARMRHAWGEAGHRTASTWSEFADWLRLGR